MKMKPHFKHIVKTLKNTTWVFKYEVCKTRSFFNQNIMT